MVSYRLSAEPIAPTFCPACHGTGDIEVYYQGRPRKRPARCGMCNGYGWRGLREHIIGKTTHAVVQINRNSRTVCGKIDVQALIMHGMPAATRRCGRCRAILAEQSREACGEMERVR